MVLERAYSACVDFPGMDFDMDLELPAGLPDTAASAAPVPSEPVSLPNEQDFAALAQWDTPAAPSAEPAVAAADNGLNLNLDDLASFSLPATASQAPAPVAAPAPAEQHSLNALEFDLDGAGDLLHFEGRSLRVFGPEGE